MALLDGMRLRLEAVRARGVICERGVGVKRDNVHRLGLGEIKTAPIFSATTSCEWISTLKLNFGTKCD